MTEQLMFVNLEDTNTEVNAIKKSFNMIVKKRADLYGVATLADEEIISVITGIDITLIRDALKNWNGFREFSIRVDELEASTVQKRKLKMLFEFAGRFYSHNEYKKSINTPNDAANLLMAEMRYLTQEHFKIVMLDVKNKIMKQSTISIGTLNSSVVHPRDVFSEPIKIKCAGIILVHNHPSGGDTTE